MITATNQNTDYFFITRFILSLITVTAVIALRAQHQMIHSCFDSERMGNQNSKWTSTTPNKDSDNSDRWQKPADKKITESDSNSTTSSSDDDHDDEAEEVREEQPNEQPSSPTAEIKKQLGNYFFQNKNYRKAIELYTQAIGIQPHASYYTNR